MSKMVMPGDNVEMLCEIHHPLAMEQGQRFNVREGGRSANNPWALEHVLTTNRTVATGLVTRIYE